MADFPFQCVAGDRLTPISRRLYDDGFDNDLASATVYFRLVDATTNAVSIATTITGVTIQPGKTFTADMTNKWFLCNAHGFKDGWEVFVSTATTLPTPLSASSRYFVRDARPNYFKLALEPNGPAVDPTSAGTGTHTIKVFGHALYSPQATWGTVAPAGTYKAWFIVEIGGIQARYPNTDTGFAVTIQAAN